MNIPADEHILANDGSESIAGRSSRRTLSSAPGASPRRARREGLLSIEQLRERMPVLRQRQQALTVELQAIADQTNDRAVFMRLAETLTAFLARLRSAAETLSVIERQKIVRLLVKDVLVGEDTITIRHSIPIPSSPPQNEESGSSDGRNYPLCKGRALTAAGQHLPQQAGSDLGGTVFDTRDTGPVRR